MRIKNDDKAIYKALNLDERTLKHITDFVLSAKQGGKKITIFTRPLDIGYIEVVSVVNETV